MNNEPLFRPKTLATASALALVLTACGGGGGGGGVASTPAAPSTPAPTPTDDGSGDGSTTETPARRLSGSITGFGSVFVGGVRFETDDAEIIIDGEPASEEDLGIGMVVLLDGIVNDGGTTGTATRIVYDDELTGPIERIELNVDGDAARLVVLGFTVIVDADTVFEDATLETLSVGDLVEVSGFPTQGNRLRATRIEREDDFVPGSTTVELRGIARNVAPGSFTIGEIAVDSSGAIIDEDDGPLVDGVRVEVEGTLAEGVLTAAEVETEEGPVPGLEPGDAVSVQGPIGSFQGIDDFRVRGVPVTGSPEVLAPADLVLDNGVVVQVDGRWDGERVVAARIGSRRGRIEIAGPVSGVDPGAGTLAIELYGLERVEISTDAGTRFDDDLSVDDEDFGLDDLNVADFLEVEAFFLGDALVATIVKREDDDEEETLQAPVESFKEELSVTLLGVTYSVDGDTEYENLQDNDIPATAFFAQLQPGDLVKVRDDDADGFAEEIEFEDKGRLDGEREFGCGFDNDGTSCDDDDLIGDDTTSDDDGIDTAEDEDDLSDDDGIDTAEDEDDLSDDDGIDTTEDTEDSSDDDGIDTTEDTEDSSDEDGIDTPDGDGSATPENEEG